MIAAARVNFPKAIVMPEGCAISLMKKYSPSCQGEYTIHWGSSDTPVTTMDKRAFELDSNEEAKELEIIHSVTYLLEQLGKM